METRHGHRQQRQYGLSLIEMMFVIAVMATIGVYFAVNLKIGQQNRALERSALEMQNWLQGGLTYLVRTNKWPTTMGDLYQGNTPYLVKENLCSPWHTPSGTTNCNGRSEYQLDVSKPPYFGMSINTPSSEIAQKLAAQLPAAVVVGAKVTSYIPPPGSAFANPDGLLIKGFYELEVKNDNGTKITQVPCPPGWTFDYQVAMHNNEARAWIEVLFDVVAAYKDQKPSRLIGTWRDLNVPWTSFVMIRFPGSARALGVSGSVAAITFCVPPGYANKVNA